MSSGVGVSEEAIKAFQDLKLRKSYRYISYKLSDDNKSIVIENTVPTSSYDEFIESLPEEDCRFYVFDFEYEAGGEGTRSKILLIVWSPETAKVKCKMLYASSKDAFKKRLNGIFSEVQCTDYSEIAYDYVLDKISRVVG